MEVIKLFEKLIKKTSYQNTPGSLVLKPRLTIKLVRHLKNFVLLLNFIILTLLTVTLISLVFVIYKVQLKMKLKIYGNYSVIEMNHTLLYVGTKIMTFNNIPNDPTD